MTKTIRVRAVQLFIAQEGTIDTGTVICVSEARAKELHSIGVVQFVDQPSQPANPSNGPAMIEPLASSRQARALQPTMSNRAEGLTASPSTTHGDSPASPEPSMRVTSNGGKSTRRRSKRVSLASDGPQTKPPQTDSN